MYIGETGDFEARFNQHFMNTYKHSDRCVQKCKGCKEHTKYLKHKSVSPHRWIMIPVAVCQEKYEAKRVERAIIKKLKPNLNKGDKPFWMLKDTYAADNRRRVRKFTERQPWLQCQGCEPDTTDTLSTSSNEMQYQESNDTHSMEEYTHELTQYSIGTEVAYDVGVLFSAYEGQKCTIQVNRGKSDVTKWHRLKKIFGPSEIIITDGNDSFKGILAEWTITNRKPDQRLTYNIIIRPERYAEENINDTLEEIELTSETFQRCSEDDLHFYWRVRNDLDKAKKYKWRQLLWEELQRR